MVRKVADKKNPISPKSSATVTSTSTIRLVLAIITALLYINTIGYKFTLDDDMFYLKHASVQKGFSGLPELFTKGSLNQFDGSTGVQPYRPVTLLSFTLEKVLFNNSSAASHFLNVLLYVLLIQVLFSVLKRLFDNMHPVLIGLITLLYAVHPIHTEVVCSVKSRDELLAALFGFLAWREMLKDGLDVKSIWKAAGYLLLALLSKESAIAFLAIIPLSLFLLKSYKIPATIKNALPLLLVTVLFLTIRFAVIGNEPSNNGLPLLENVLHGANSFAQASATRMVILFHYLRLTIFPWPLNWDYSYNQIPLVDWSSLLAIISILVHVGLLIVAAFNLNKNRTLSFLILFYFISSAPTNNLFFINGATIGERFLFVPSLAFPIAVISLLAQMLKIKADSANLKSLTIAGASIALVFSVMTITRSADWKDNFSLFKRGVEISPNSSRTNYSLANSYFDLALQQPDPQSQRDYMTSALSYYKRSLEIYPDNFQALYNSGIAFAVSGDTSSAIQYYRRTIEANGKYLNAYNNLGVLYQAKMNFDSAFYYYDAAFRIDSMAPAAKPNLSNLFFNQGLVFAAKSDPDNAIASYKKSLEYNPNNPMPLNNLASLYSQNKDYSNALYYLKIGYASDPSNMMILENIAAVSYLNREYDQAILFANKALAMDNNRKKSLGVLADTYQAMGNLNEATKYRARYNAIR